MAIVTETEERAQPALGRLTVVRLLALAALFNLGMAAWLVLTAYTPEAIRGSGNIPDFAAFWAAGKLALEGTPWLAYDAEAHRAVERAGVGVPVEKWMVWHYPPTVQMLVAPVAAFPFWPAMALWLVLGFAAFAAVAWRVVPGWPTILGCVAVAPTLMLLVNGQTGFWIAALAGLMLLERARRPWLSGLTLGLLSVKPQIVLGLPLMALVEGRWRVLAGAVVTVAALVILSLGLLGAAPWQAFLTGGAHLSDVMTRADWRTELQATIGGGLLHYGMDYGPAMILHGAVATGSLILCWRAWRDPAASPALNASLACYLSALIAPRIMSYDLHLLFLGALFQIRHARMAGFFAGEAAVLLSVAAMAQVTVFWPPLFNPVLAPILFFACWWGHVRRRIRRGVTRADGVGSRADTS